jgi:hypothetical protein
MFFLSLHKADPDGGLKEDEYAFIFDRKLKNEAIPIGLKGSLKAGELAKTIDFDYLCSP